MMDRGLLAGIGMIAPFFGPVGASAPLVALRVKREDPRTKRKNKAQRAARKARRRGEKRY